MQSQQEIVSHGDISQIDRSLTNLDPHPERPEMCTRSDSNNEPLQPSCQNAGQAYVLKIQHDDIELGPSCETSFASLATGTSSMVPEKTPSRLSPKRYTRLLRNARWTWLSVYRRLCILVLLPNILTMVILGTRHRLLSMPASSMLAGVSLNITAAVLMRQDFLVNGLFMLFGKCPHWVPLAARRCFAKIYHHGGVHSGTGIAAAVWFTLFNVVVCIEVAKTPPKEGLQLARLIITVIIDLLLIAIVALAHPRFRSQFHDHFEAVHRFAGWTAVILLWAHLFILAEIERKAVDFAVTLGQIVSRSVSLYCLIINTISLLLPWLQLRRVRVYAEPMSSHAVRLHFPQLNVPLCASPRISDRPLVEWHSFAGIPYPSGTGCSVIISNAGDWTAKIIAGPPSSLWLRGFPTRGVLSLALIFKKVVLVATGSGIGPILSLLTARGLNSRIIWSASKPEITYSPDIVEDVRRSDPEAIIVDSSISGRPDLVQLTHDLFRESDSEAIFIISNPVVTRKVVYSLEARGLPIFAPIFDS